jgi:hypothetical protein
MENTFLIFAIGSWCAIAWVGIDHWTDHRKGPNGKGLPGQARM